MTIEPPVSEPSQSSYGFVGYLSKLGAFGFKIPSQEPKRLVCIVGYSGDMGFPGKVTCNIHTQVPGGVYNLKILAV